MKSWVAKMGRHRFKLALCPSWWRRWAGAPSVPELAPLLALLLRVPGAAALAVTKWRPNASVAGPALTPTLLPCSELVVPQLPVCLGISLACVSCVPLPLPGGSDLLLSSPGTSKGTSSQQVLNGTWCLKLLGCVRSIL